MSFHFTLKKCGAVLAVAALPMAFGCGSPEPAFESGSESYVNLDPGVKYVGPEACARCHPAKAEVFVHSEMGRSFKTATLSNSAAQFEGMKPVYDPHLDLYYEALAEGEDLYIKEFRLERGDTVHVRIEKIDYIVGSGQHTNSHIMDVNGYLFQMPLTWYVQDGKWDLPPGFEGGVNKRFDRMIEIECMSCHNATPEYVPSSGNRYRSVPLGIDCERCHGPGQAHVQAVESGRVVDVTKTIDRTIVNPAKLSPDLQFDICQRCHLQGTTVTADGKSFLDFRPGMRLSDVLKVFQPRYADSLEQFIMASHPDRLRMSQCYLESQPMSTSEAHSSEAQMTCITCHDPHVSIESMPPDTYRTACVSCHENRAVRECSEPIESRTRNGDDCAACHMPSSGSKDIPHVRITDHFIRVPQDGISPQEVERQKEFVQLASLSDSRPADEVIARGYLAHYEQFEHRPQFLDSAQVYLNRALQTESRETLAESLVRLWFLKGEYGSVTGLAEGIAAGLIDDPWTLYRIGESYGKAGNVQKSIEYFEQAVSLAPDHLQFRTRLATTYTADRQLERAVQMFDSILTDHPKWAEAYNNRGFAFALLGDFERAEADFEQSISLDPDFEQALGNLASLYANTSRSEEARKYLERLMKIDPDNANYRRLYEVL
ncbi:MAG: tetratricopeptide repeat protein [Rhodothermales bacterium]|nr:tetratricopeptide repeat protein [Rhodothermales bacterium]